MAAARSADDPAALVAALDGLKTALPLRRRRAGDGRRPGRAGARAAPSRRPVAAAVVRLRVRLRGGGGCGLGRPAEQRMRAATEINRRSGYQAYGIWFDAYLGWLLRLTGRHDEALDVGRRAVAATGRRAAPVVALDRLPPARRDAGRGRRGERGGLGPAGGGSRGSRAGRSRGIRPGLPRVARGRERGATELSAADVLMRNVHAPDGQAWLLGSESYLALARAWLTAGDPVSGPVRSWPRWPPRPARRAVGRCWPSRCCRKRSRARAPRVTPPRRRSPPRRWRWPRWPACPVLAGRATRTSPAPDPPPVP